MRRPEQATLKPRPATVGESAIAPRPSPMREERTKFAAARVVIILGPRPLGRLAAATFFVVFSFEGGLLDLVQGLNLIETLTLIT